MVSLQLFCQLTLQLKDVNEKPHFQKRSFCVGKKIFATLDEKEKKAVLKLTETDQSIYCLLDSTAIYPVPGRWGKQGWTSVCLEKTGRDIMAELLQKAHHAVASKR